MNKKYHIPINIIPTEEQIQWAVENIWPIVSVPYNNAEFDMGRVDFDQTLAKQWSLYPTIKKHLDDVGVGLRRLAAFYCRDKTNKKPIQSAHIDAYQGLLPLVARFNIPITGQSTAILKWWDVDITDPRGHWIERHFIEYKNNRPINCVAITTTLDDWSELPVEYESVSPGACWNRTNIAHQMNYYNTNSPRFVITAEPLRYDYTWDELVEKLSALGHC